MAHRFIHLVSCHAFSMSIFRDSSAPFAIALVISVFGWLFASAIQRAETLRLVEYETEFGKIEDVTTLSITFHNRSLAGALRDGDFLVTCIDADGRPLSGCLASLPGLSEGREATYVATGEILLDLETRTIDTKTIELPAVVPVGGTTTYRIGVTSQDVRFRVQYDLSDFFGKADAQGAGDRKAARRELPRVIINEGLTLLGFAMRNYFSIIVGLLAVMLAFAACFVLYALKAYFWPARPAAIAPPERASVDVYIRENG